MSVSLPGVEGNGYAVTESRDRWPMRRDAVAVDPIGRDVTDRVRFADWPLMAKLAGWGVQLHMGRLFGLPNQIGLVVLAVGLLYLIVAGYRMWWRRRPVGGLAAPPVRGAWRRLEQVHRHALRALHRSLYRPSLAGAFRRVANAKLTGGSLVRLRVSAGRTILARLS